MAEHYTMKFVNATDNQFFFGVYQKYPHSPGLKSIAWQVRGVPPAGAIPSTAQVDWDMLYGVAITDFDAECHDSYTGQQVKNADLGSKYKVVMVQDIPDIEDDTGSVGTSQITLTNRTHLKMDLGFALGNSLVTSEEGGGGESANFEVHSTYYVALFHNIKEGQLVSSDIFAGPVEVSFQNGYKIATIEAVQTADTYKISPPKYSV